MFKQGSMIELVSSSHSCHGGKKNIGPKTGSRGFFCGEYTHIVDQKAGFINVVATVLYTRFGFEQKLRSEKKYTILLFPITASDSHNVGKHTVNLIHRVNSGGMENYRKSFLEKHDLDRNITMAIATEIFSPELLTCSTSMFKSWMESFTCGYHFVNVINEHLSRVRTKDVCVPWLDMKPSHQLKILIMERSKRRAFLSDDHISPEIRESLVERLQYFSMLKERVDIEEVLISLNDLAGHDQIVYWEPLATILMRPYSLEIIDKRTKLKKIKFCLDKIKIVRNKITEATKTYTV